MSSTGDLFVLAGDQDAAEKAGIADRHFRAVLVLQFAKAGPVVVQVGQAAVEIHVGDDVVEVVRAGGDQVALRIADLAGQAVDRAHEMGPARVRPVGLHQAAVIHRREDDQVGLGLDVLLTQLVEVQVEANRERHPPEVAVEDRGLAPAQDSRLRRLLDDHVILVVDADDLSLPVDEDAGVAPGAVVHLPGGGVDDIAAVLRGDLGEEVADLVLAYAVILKLLFPRQTADTVARLRHNDQIGPVRKNLRELPRPMRDHLVDDRLWLGVGAGRRRPRPQGRNSHVTPLLDGCLRRRGPLLCLWLVRLHSGPRPTRERQKDPGEKREGCEIPRTRCAHNEAPWENADSQLQAGRMPADHRP